MKGTLKFQRKEPLFFYRSPEKIREDMRAVRFKINEATETLNVCELLMNMITELAEGEPQRWARELEELSREASEGLEELKRFDSLLSDLICEWREVKCAMDMR